MCDQDDYAYEYDYDYEYDYEHDFGIDHDSIGLWLSLRSNYSRSLTGEEWFKKIDSAGLFEEIYCWQHMKARDLNQLSAEVTIWRAHSRKLTVEEKWKQEIWINLELKWILWRSYSRKSTADKQ